MTNTHEADINGQRFRRHMQMRHLQRFLRTVFHTLQAENALRSVYSFSGIIGDTYVHRTYPLALAAGYTLTLVALDPQYGKITHRL